MVRRIVGVEAFRTYFRHLKAGGILALNTTNRCLDPDPVMAHAATAFGKIALHGSLPGPRLRTGGGVPLGLESGIGAPTGVCRAYGQFGGPMTRRRYPTSSAAVFRAYARGSA
jgi:hypothetical protein